MSTTNITASEMFETLDGLDELAIVKAFDGANPFEYLDNGQPTLSGTLLGRALIFVHQRREGMSFENARQFALTMRTPDVIDYFASEADEAGKDDSAPSEPEPENSQPSA